MKEKEVTVELEYVEPEDYDSMSLPEFKAKINTTIDPVSMQLFADIIQQKVNTCSDLCKLCPSDCSLKIQIRDALNELSRYALKGAILNAVSADWLMDEISNVSI